MEAQDGLDELFRSKLEEGHAPVPSFSWDSIQEKVALEKERKSKKIAFPFLWMAASFITGLVVSGLFFYQYQLETENHYLKELALQNKKEQESSFENFQREETNGGSSLQVPNASYVVEEESIQDLKSATANEATSNANSVPFYSSQTLTAQNHSLELEEEPITDTTSLVSKQRISSLRVQGKRKRNYYSSTEQYDLKRASPTSYTSTILHSSANSKLDIGTQNADAPAIKEKETMQRALVAATTHSSKKNKTSAIPHETMESIILTHHNESGSSATDPAKVVVPTSSVIEEENDLGQNSTTSIKSDSLLVALLDSLPKKEIEIKKPTKDKAKLKKEPRLFGLPITLGVYIAPEWASRSLKFSGSEDPELVTYKKNDQRKFGFSAGISVDLSLPERFYIRTGINYWNVGDQNHTVIKAVKNNSDKPSTTKNNTQPTMVADTTGFIPNTISDFSLSSISFKELSSKVENNYHYLGIPALLGMKLGRSKLSAGIYSGVLVNVLLSPSRSIYYVYYDQNNPDQFTESYRELSRFSLTYWGGLDVDYKLSKSWTINVSPNVKYSLTALYKDKETVRQLPYSFGVQVGCKYSF